MSRTYVTLADPIHQLMRVLTRHTRLERVTNEDGEREIQYVFEPGALPETYYTLAVYHGLQGMALGNLRLNRWRVQPEAKAHVPAQVNFFDVVKMDRRCCRDIRLKLRKNGPGMLSADLLCYGVGMLRARNDDPAEIVHQRLLECYGRIQSRHEVVHARVHTLHWNSIPILPHPGKESFDSSNVIFGDAHGELMQLWDRRADTDFLAEVAAHLRLMRSRAEIAAHFHPPLNLSVMMQLHLRAQAVWRQPPPSARSLLHRIEFLLDHTVVDPSAVTVFQPLPAESSPPPKPGRSRTGWQGDASGYDGWLAEPAG